VSLKAGDDGICFRQTGQAMYIDLKALMRHAVPQPAVLSVSTTSFSLGDESQLQRHIEICFILPLQRLEVPTSTAVQWARPVLSLCLVVGEKRLV